jgi:hypothetical protein
MADRFQSEIFIQKPLHACVILCYRVMHHAAISTAPCKPLGSNQLLPAKKILFIFIAAAKASRFAASTGA